MSFPKVSTLKSAEQLRRHLQDLSREEPWIDLRLDDEVETGSDSPLASSLTWEQGTIGNRFCILPMEGWDGTTDGQPTDLTRRRWKNFGLSGAKLIWGGEAVAVRPDGRANPNQLLINDGTLGEIVALRELLEATHRDAFGRTDDLLVGLQLTHSGRFARPNAKTRPEPRIAYRHPLLDRRVGVDDDAAVFTDDELDRLVADFVAAAVLADRAGYAFIDLKHCHGYFGHELLSAYERPGRYGGSLENRTRFLRSIIEGIAAEAPALKIGVRLSVTDLLPYEPGPEGIGQPMKCGDYRFAFGGDGRGGIDLTETRHLLDHLRELGVRLICTTIGSPYYNPHIQRPAAFPPTDGYLPPEDPLVGVARQIAVTGELKKSHPDLIFVGSGYSYLQDWLPNVGQRAIRDGLVDFVGLGRMVLSYPELPADVLAGRPLARKKVCRTFSDCTTGPRNGQVSGCFPLDPFYKQHPAREVVTAAKRAAMDRLNEYQSSSTDEN